MRGYRIEGEINNTLKSVGNIPSGLKQQGERLGLNDQVEQRPWLMIGAAVAAGYVLANLLGDDSESDERDYRDYANGNAPRSNNRPMPSPSFYSDHPSSAPMQPNNASASAGSASYGGPSNYGAPTPSSSAPAPSSSAMSASYSVSPSNAPASAPSSDSTLSSAASSLSSTAGSLLTSVVGDADTLKAQATDMIRSILRDTIRENLPQLSDQIDELDRRKPRNT